MHHEGIFRNEVTYVCIMEVCAIIGVAHESNLISDEIVRQGLLRNDIVLGTGLMDVCVKYGAYKEWQDAC